MEENNEFKHIITFGLDEDMKCEFPGARPTYITKLTNDKYIAPTCRQIYLFSRGKAAQSFPYKFSIIEYIECINAFVGVQLGTTQISIISATKGFPLILENFNVKQGSVSQIIFSKEPHTLILCGYTTTFIDFKVFHPRYQEFPTITLTIKNTVSMSDLTAPGFRVYFDERKQRIVVPTKSGYSIYSMNGDLMQQNNTISSAIACHTSSFLFSQNDVNLTNKVTMPFKRYLTTDSEGRVRVWHSSETLLSEYITRSNDFIFSEFINSEFVVLVSATNDVILLDIKTGKNETLRKLPGPPKIIRLFQGMSPRLAVLCANTFHIFKLKNPWSLFRRLSAAPVIIRRCISQNRAARICVLTSNSFLSMFSPSLGQFLMSAGAKVPSRIKDFIYDRGIVRYNEQVLDTSSHERLFFITEDKKVLAFKETDDSWEFAKQLEMSPRIITVAAAFEPSRLVFCCFADAGDLLIYDYEDFSPITRICFDQKTPLFVHFHYGTGLLLIIYHNEIVGMNLKTFQITFRERIRKPIHAAFDDDICVFAYSDCSVSVLEFQLNGLTEITSFTCPEEVKLVNIESHVFFAVTVMNTILFGQTAEDITTIECPYDISAISVLNPDIDILIGLDKELMVIRRADVYPWLQPILHCPEDDDDPRKEQFVILKNKKIEDILKAPPLQATRAPSIRTETKAATVAPLSIDTDIPPVIEYNIVKSPKLDRKTLLKEMERITDQVELPSSPVLAKKETCLVTDAPKKRKQRPNSAKKPEQKITNSNNESNETSQTNEQKPEILNILDQYKDVLAEKSASSQSRRRRKSRTKSSSSNKEDNQEKESPEPAALEGINEEEPAAAEEEKHEEIKKEEEEQKETNKEEEQKEIHEEEEEAKEEPKDTKKLAPPVSVTNLEIIAKGEGPVVKGGIYNFSTRKSGKQIDMNRLSSEFQNKLKQRSQALSQSLKFGDQIALKISVLRTSKNGKPDFSQTMNLSFAKNMPLQMVSEATRPSSQLKSTDPSNIVENESSSDDEVVEHYSQVSTPKGSAKGKQDGKDPFLEELKKRGIADEEEDSEEKEQKEETKATKLLTPKKQTNQTNLSDVDETNEDGVDAFLGDLPEQSPTKDRPHISFAEEVNEEPKEEEGEEFEELRSTNFVKKHFEIEEPVEIKPRVPNSQDTPRRHVIHPPTTPDDYEADAERKRSRSRSPPSSPRALLPMPPLPIPKDDMECTPFSPMKKQLENIKMQEESNYPSTSRSSRSSKRNPRFSSRRSQEERETINRLEEFDLPRERRRTGAVCTGRVAIGGPIKPLGDVEMAVIIQPLPRKSTNPYSRNKKK